MIIIFAGHIGRCCTGGQAWANMQYLAGFRSLGHEVYYLEDCGETSWVYNWDAQEWTEDLAYPARFVRECLEPFGFGDRWIYRSGDRSEGMAGADFQEVCSQADLLVARAIPLWVWRPEYDRARRSIFIDVDPGFTQMRMLEVDQALTDALRRYDRVFTIAQRMGAPDCQIPAAGFSWFPTRPPVSLSDWPVAPQGPASHFTSVMRWQGFINVSHEGQKYGQKDQEFPKFLDLPRLTSQKFRLALMGVDLQILIDRGWEVAPGDKVAQTPSLYRCFIQGSRGEFCVPKHGYVAMRGGWFSDRSVAYLASGRPVLMEDTGLQDWLPTGEGAVLFSDLPSAVAGIEAINSDYERHRLAARHLAEEHFAAERVLPELLDAAMGS